MGHSQFIRGMFYELGPIYEHAKPAAHVGSYPEVVDGQLRADGEVKWVPFLPRGIAATLSRGMNVISAPFSGCYMIKYRFGPEQVEYVAHVSTPDAKDKWNKFVKDFGVHIVCGFKPFDPLQAAQDCHSYRAICDNGRVPICFGVIAADNACYSLSAFRNGKSPNLYRCASYTLSASLDENSLRHLI